MMTLALNEIDQKKDNQSMTTGGEGNALTMQQETTSTHQKQVIVIQSQAQLRQ